MTNTNELLIILPAIAVLITFLIGIIKDAKDSMHKLYPDENKAIKSDKHKHPKLQKQKI